MQYEITVNKVGPKWAQITVHYSTGRDGKAKIAVKAVADIPVQQRGTVRGYIDRHETKYGSDPELILITEEEDAARNAERKRSEITRWLGYFDEKAKAGYYYDRAVSEIQGLGCHDYDAHFHESRILILKNKVKAGMQKGYISANAVAELRSLGCSDMDEVISAFQKKISAEREKAREEKAAAQEKAGIREIRIPAPAGFNGRPQKGSTLMYNNVPYEVISSFYYSSDGRSFGVMSEEWYSVKVRDISDTATGKEMLAEAEKASTMAFMQRSMKEAESRIISISREKGKVYNGLLIGTDAIPGETILDNMDAYGGGYMVKDDGNTVYVITNNGSDGSDCSFNTIRTGGAGAYCHAVAREYVAHEIRNYLAAKKLLEDHQVN